LYSAEKLVVRDNVGQIVPEGMSLLMQGAGALNVLGAVDLVTHLSTYAMVNTVRFSGALPTLSVLTGGTVQGGRTLPYGTLVYSGLDLFNVRQWLLGYSTVLWGDSVLWGDMSLQVGLTGDP
jgi:hypothetical protein